MNKHQIIGSRQKRVDALGKVTGAAKYAADYNIPFQLYGAVKYAEYPHAIIKKIVTAEAEKLAGVTTVLTCKDVPGKNHFGLIPNIRILADDRTRYLGDVVAIVAAENIKTANQAVEMIQIEYEELPAVFDPEEALKPNAVKLYDEGNQIVHHKVRKGNITEGFRQADFIIENKFTTQAIEHAYLEPEAALAMPDEHDGFKIIGCMQNFYTSHKVIAGALDKPLSKVQIIQSTMGGSFGGKDESATLVAVRAALLAQKTGRPVKMVNSREDSFI
ncbi:MAG TPA: xanthine dehydrogenase, partial [Caldithrix sp.]|nr:xanthine dehydrogenase [Caldithrix sp.]